MLNRSIQIAIAGVLFMGCGEAPNETEGFLPKQGVWEAKTLTYESDCDNSGSDVDMLSWQEVILLYTVPDYMDLSVDEDGTFRFAPETLMDEVICDLSNGTFDCPEQVDVYNNGDPIVTFNRTFGGTFTPVSATDEDAQATEGEFFFRTDVVCEGEACAEIEGSSCYVDSVVTVSYIGEIPPDEGFSEL